MLYILPVNKEEEESDDDAFGPKKIIEEVEAAVSVQSSLHSIYSPC